MVEKITNPVFLSTFNFKLRKLKYDNEPAKHLNLLILNEFTHVY